MNLFNYDSMMNSNAFVASVELDRSSHSWSKDGYNPHVFGCQMVGTCVYLMYSPTTNLYKIGVSNNPYERRYIIEDGGRHALPNFSVNLICAYPYKTSKEAFLKEERLHRFYNSKRRHKEWFDLDYCDVYNIALDLQMDTANSQRGREYVYDLNLVQRILNG